VLVVYPVPCTALMGSARKQFLHGAIMLTTNAECHKLVTLSKGVISKYKEMN